MRTAFEDSRHSGRMGLKEPAARKLVFKQQEELCLTGQRLNQYYAAKVSEYFAHEILCGVERSGTPPRCPPSPVCRNSLAAHSSGEGVKPAGQTIGARPAYLFESKTL